ncbi:hypothetical protein [Nonomuraea aridisoli]|uniref:Lipoprotein n=1 Tax=Nonomuraea aridisoli TaxID=2070368 RepID=A0A2W2F2D7_9ACTN|nr:hypothetical protein [Nonomuraea aridisoli]PZG23479.1 hypothetical protein C1J01_00715 [Nonomuraea aridisoli]
MNRRAGRWRRAYGAGPWHLLLLAACFALAAYAATRVVAAGIWTGFLVWFVGAVIVHDLVLFPLYSTADIAARAVSGRSPAINHLRVPAGLSGLLLLVWFPLVLRASERNYKGAVGLSTAPYLARWLAITVALFAGSGLLYALRRRGKRTSRR